MEEEDILGSSLFYSCMSSVANDDHEIGARAQHHVVSSNNERSVPIKAAELMPTANVNRQTSEDKGSIPSQPETKERSNITAEVTAGPSTGISSNPSSNSNSSWSVLSENERPAVRSITFNRDRTCLIVCTNVGVRIRTLESLSLSSNLHVENDDANNNANTNNNPGSAWIHDVPLPPDGATYAQLLHNTSLLAVVKPDAPRICFLYNAKNAASPLAALSLSAAVKRVELQHRVLVAMTVDLRLHVFHMTDGGDTDTEKKPLRPTLITTLNIMHPSDSTRNVTRGLDGYNAGSYFDLSANYLVCKSYNATPGTIRVYDPTIVHSIASVASNASIGSGSARSTASSWDKHNSPPLVKKIKRRIHLLTTINAHDHSVTRMLIGGGGKDQQTFLATVSSKGTTIRVFGLPTGEHLFEWHRGSRACQFYSLSWNGSADRLVSFGSSGTIHVFDWQKKKQPTEMVESVGGLEFEQVSEDVPARELNKAGTGNPKPLLRRIGSSIKKRATGSSINDVPSKHRSCVKMKYKPSALTSNLAAGTANSNAKASARSQPLVLALLDRNHSEGRKNDLAEREDSLALCSLDGELRQYVLTDKTIEVVQIEDILARR